MAKHKLILLDWLPGSSIPFYTGEKFNFFGLTFNEVFSKYFTYECYNENATYSKEDIFVILDIYNYDKFNQELPKYKSLMSRGFKLMIWLFPEYLPVS